MDPARTGLFRLRLSSRGCWSCGGWKVCRSLPLMASLLISWRYKRSWLPTPLGWSSISRLAPLYSCCVRRELCSQRPSLRLSFLSFSTSGGQAVCVSLRMIKCVPNRDLGSVNSFQLGSCLGRQERFKPFGINAIIQCREFCFYLGGRGNHLKKPGSAPLDH